MGPGATASMMSCSMKAIADGEGRVYLMTPVANDVPNGR